ncbi:transcriptional regulator, Crp/Fnr family [Magnetococcus marinus MC-1]|uniref:Transcriptional regulator, Crp/Fnr family n=1 Tax=Magnetococcus marinus (strain ATCC BAA-1437 / JCM 17883 / MC-1) TaxID=156889 RepID=A0L4U2_MAGMM|nr:Crp/Fnr family transcriptional regulator [Magnetococcus marinus]ABK42985.1 transcriptional regulator, Crp/Fnr family [Magnetococcus marinus MC-1]
MNHHPLKDADLDQTRKSHLFTPLSEPAWLPLAAQLSRRTLASGEILFQQGDPFEAFFLVLRGGIKLYRLSADGAEKVIEVIMPGQTFGEAVMFAQGNRYPVTAEALEATVLVAVPSSAYMAMLQRYPEASVGLLKDMSQRLHHLVMEVDRVTLQRARERLLSYLGQQVACGNGSSCTLKMPRKVLASRLSMQPETLSRLFRGLKDQGIIAEQGQIITVLDPHAVQEGYLDEL